MGGLAVLAAVAGVAPATDGSASARVMPDVETAFRSTAVLEQVVRPEVILRVTPAIPTEGSRGEARTEAWSQTESVKRTPTPGLSSATPSVCGLAGELHPYPPVPAPQPLGPAREAVYFIAAGTCTVVAKTGRQAIALLQTQFEIEPAEVRQSITVTAPPHSPAVRKQAEDLLKALRLPAGAKSVRSDPSAGAPTAGAR